MVSNSVVHYRAYAWGHCQSFCLFCLFIYLFIIKCCTEGKFLTQSAKNLSYWVTSFRRWL